MNSLREIFATMEEVDQEKVAHAQPHGEAPNFDDDLIKQAQEYDSVGRVLAHHVFADMVKEAVEADEDSSKEEKKKRYEKLMRKAKGEKSEDDDKDDKDEGDEDEKKASVKAAVLERMQQDPEYVQYLLSKHMG